MERNKINSVLAERIGKLRENAGETQQQLADALNVKRETVKFWESGDRQIKGADIVALADHFDVSADYLLGRTAAATTVAELRTACDFTGLDEVALIWLNALNAVVPDYLAILSDFLYAHGLPFASQLSLIKSLCNGPHIDTLDDFLNGSKSIPKDALEAWDTLEAPICNAAYKFDTLCRDIVQETGLNDVLNKINKLRVLYYKNQSQRTAECDNGEYQEN